MKHSLDTKCLTKKKTSIDGYQDTVYKLETRNMSANLVVTAAAKDRPLRSPRLTFNS